MARSRLGPESCAAICENRREVLTGESMAGYGAAK